jgi:hypothetical protein
MTPMPLARRAPVGALAALFFVACTADRSRSPVCGMSLLVGPSLIQQQLNNARAILSDVPRGMPASLPARVAGEADTARALVATDHGRLVLSFAGKGFPPVQTDSTRRDSSVFGLLLVDDSTDVVKGVLVFAGGRPPKEYPRLGTIVGDDQVVPLFGIRLAWTAVSNPRCPLLGTPPAP